MADAEGKVGFFRISIDIAPKPLGYNEFFDVALIPSTHQYRIGIEHIHYAYGSGQPD